MNNNFFFCNDKAAAIMAAVKNPILSKAVCNTVDLLPLLQTHILQDHRQIIPSEIGRISIRGDFQIGYSRYVY